MGDRAGEGRAYGSLGTGHMYLNEYDKAVAYFIAQDVLAISLKLAHMLLDAAMDIGVALTLHVQAARQGPATGADPAPGPLSHSSASACMNDRVREAAKWLQAAFDGGHEFAKLHLAHFTFDAGQEDAALEHLKEHLSWRVQRGRDTCASLGEWANTGRRHAYAHVQRLPCSEVLQRRSPNHGFEKAALGGRLFIKRNAYPRGAYPRNSGEPRATVTHHIYS